MRSVDVVYQSHTLSLTQARADNIVLRPIIAENMTSTAAESLKETKEEEERQLYKGAFDDFDWNKNGTIPTRVRQ